MDVARASWRPRWPTRSARWRSSPARRATRVRYVKPHGALYNRCRARREQASALVVERCARDADAARARACPAHVSSSWPAGRGLPSVTEAFADRAYTARALAARAVPGAVLDHTAAVAQALSLATDGTATLPAMPVASPFTPGAYVCTGIHPTRSRWREPFAPNSTTPVSRWVRSHERGTRARARGRRPGCARWRRTIMPTLPVWWDRLRADTPAGVRGRVAGGGNRSGGSW